MAQHDNGRRAAGQQSGAWQQGQRDQQDHSNAQQDQSSSSGRYGSQHGGGQQGGHDDRGGSRGHQDQYDSGRGQQGDNWREQQGSPGGYRLGMEERSRGGQGSFGGQASDNDYGNRGITESGNFGNYGSQRDNYGTLSGQGRHAQGGSYDQGGQSSQRFGGGYRHGYDARSDSTGGYGSGNFGPDQNYGSGNYGDGDFNAGSYGSRGSNDWNRERAWNDANRQRGFNDNVSTYGQSSADRGQNWQGPGNQDRYGDDGYQGNWQQGQRGQSYHDPDYHQWRSEQLSRLDRDYDEWRQHRYQRFSEDFDNWRSNRDNDPNRAKQGRSQSDNAGSTNLGASGGTSDTSDTHASAPHSDKGKAGDGKK